MCLSGTSCGCNLATDCPSGPTEILDGGRLGRLVRVGDAVALAAAIRATLAERAAGVPRPDPWPVLMRYTEQGAVGAYVRLVDELTAGRPR